MRSVLMSLCLLVVLCSNAFASAYQLADGETRVVNYAAQPQEFMYYVHLMRNGGSVPQYDSFKNGYGVACVTPDQQNTYFGYSNGMNSATNVPEVMENIEVQRTGRTFVVSFHVFSEGLGVAQASNWPTNVSAKFYFNNDTLKLERFSWVRYEYTLKNRGTIENPIIEKTPKIWEDVICVGLNKK